MNCQSARDLLPELLDRRTAPSAHAEARAHLAGCPECQRELAALRDILSAVDTLPMTAPSPRLRRDFYAMLETEKRSEAGPLRPAAALRPRGGFWRQLALPLAGCALLAFGFLAGQRTGMTPAIAPDEPSTQQELAALRTQMVRQEGQLAKMTTLVTYSLLQQQQHPATERLQQLLADARQEQPSERTLDTLIGALTLDPNVSIRLRAIEALYPHAERELVRAGVRAALPREQNPLVLLELIEFVTLTEDRGAVPLLERMSANDNADEAVRDAAKLALARF